MMTEALMRRFLSLPVEEQRARLNAMTPEDLLAFDAWFEAWAHKGQLPPGGVGWRVWLMLAGRGYGKTRAGAEWIHRLASGRSKFRVALVGASIDEARKVMVEGVSGILSVARLHRQKVKWEPSLGRLTWRNGSVSELFSGDHADGLRGPQHHFAWCDELAKWRQGEAAWDNLQMGLRAGPRPRALVTTPPRTLPLLNRIRKDAWTVQTGGSTRDNVNLARSFAEVMMATYGGTRLGRQELDGELFDDVEGSLWPKELIERARSFDTLSRPGSTATQDEQNAFFDRIVVGVDPPAGVGEGCDACGIVVAGRAAGRLYVLEDASVAGLRPEGWANRVAAAAERWDASLVVAEANNGGAMVESVLKAAEAGLRVKLVHASRGKAARAEPMALRFEAGRAFFAGVFPQLEAELSGLTAGGGYDGARSPDRADAMVWAMSELSETKSGVPRVRRL